MSGDLPPGVSDADISAEGNRGEEKPCADCEATMTKNRFGDYECYNCGLYELNRRA